MKVNKWKLKIMLLILTLITSIMNAQNNKELNIQEQSLVKISSLTAVGNIEKLKTQLNAGLDNELSINQIKEALTQLYAYCGFPRSLNAINTFKIVLEERKEKGIKDIEGKEIIVKNDPPDKYEQGRKVLETLTKTPQSKPAPGFGEFVPRIDTFLKSHINIGKNTGITDEQLYQTAELIENTINKVQADTIRKNINRNLSK